MLGKTALRLVTAALLVGVALGAQQVSGATLHHAHAVAASGVVVLTDWQEPDGCGPGFGNTVVDISVCGAVEMGTSTGLFTVDNHTRYIADLTESVPTLQNGGAKIVNGDIVVTYRLKPNLKWSDGVPLTMNDWKYSVQLGLAMGATFGIDQIRSIRVVDARTAVVTMKGKYIAFVENAQPLFFVPKHYLEKKFHSTDINKVASGFGSDLYNSPSDVFFGRYKIQSWSSDGSNVVLVPNPYYTAFPPAPGHPIPAQIKYVNITTDPAALAADLGSSKAAVDKAEDFQFDALPLLYRSKFHLTVQPALEFEHLELNTAGQLKDVRVRQALQYAIDKRGLIRQLFPALRNPTNYLLHSVVPNSSEWSDKSLPINDYNPAKARALLQAAGYATSFSGPGKHLLLRVYTTKALIRQKDVQVLSKYWAAVGVHTVPNFIKGSGNNGLFSAYNSNGILYQRRFDVALFAFSIPPDPQQFEPLVDPSHIPTAAHHVSGIDQNYTGAGPAQFHVLLQARYATDSAARHAILNRWQHIMHDQVYYIPLYNRANITVDDGKIGNYKPNPTSAGNTWNSFEWYKKGAM